MNKELTEKELNILKARFLELAKKSEDLGIYTYTGFLGLLEQSLYHSMEKMLHPFSPTLYGGIKDAERILIRFGKDDFKEGFEDYPIKALLITPISPRFSESLSHKDVLGALMNLGIKRSLLGDIYVKENSCLVFCLDKISEYIKENLFKIKHTEVTVGDFPGSLSDYSQNFKEMSVQISSERLDAVLSKVLGLSREKSQDLFRKKLVFVNGKQITSASHTPKAEDKITVRGFGRLTYLGKIKSTKKGNLLVGINLYT